MEGELVDCVNALADMKWGPPDFSAFVATRVTERFRWFTEENIGDLCRSFTKLRFRRDAFFATLGQELPFVLHEYQYWNLIDVALSFLELRVRNRDLEGRFGSETFKLIFQMKCDYVGQALKFGSGLGRAEPAKRQEVP